MFHKLQERRKSMNTLMLILGLIWVIAFVAYTKTVATKTFNKKSTSILATVVAPIVILFLAIYTTAHSVVRIAMINDPEILTDTIKELEEVEKQKQEKAAKESLKNVKEDDSKFAPTIGNLDGDVVIYEFFDFNCGYCKRGNMALRQVLDSDKNVKVVLKNYPIFPFSQIPAKAEIAAKEQGVEKLEAFHNALFEANLMPERDAKATEKDINDQIKAIVFGVAQKAGLDVEKLKKDMEAPSVEEELLRTRQLAEKLGIQGTPAFIVGEKFFRGYVDTPVIIEAIEASR